MNSSQIAIDLFLRETNYKNEEISKVKQIHKGFTNISFLFTTKDHQKYQVRVGNDNGVVYRISEKAILEATKNTDFIYYDLGTGNAIKKWIPGKNPGFITSRRKWLLKELVEEIKNLHETDISKYKDRIRVHDYTAYLSSTEFLNDKHLNKYLELIKKYKDLKMVLSHNDINLDNCLYHRRKISLIDFEWGRINNEYWDLANFIRESGISIYRAKKMCEYYKDLEWSILQDFIYLSTNFAYQWTYIMEQTPKITKYRKKVAARLEHYYLRFF